MIKAMKQEMKRVLIFVILFTGLTVVCSKNPGEPEPPDPSDPCLECPPVIVEVEIPVICSQFDATVEFTGIKDQSGPNNYLLEVEGYPDELVSIIDTSLAPVDTSFTRVYPNYTGGRISIRKVSGSRAEAVGVAIIDLECSQ